MTPEQIQLLQTVLAIESDDAVLKALKILIQDLLDRQNS